MLSFIHSCVKSRTILAPIWDVNIFNDAWEAVVHVSLVSKDQLVMRTSMNANSIISATMAIARTTSEAITATAIPDIRHNAATLISTSAARILARTVRSATT